jgi:hypothetical protein
MAETRIVFRGKVLNTRTRDMILAAEKILGYQLQIIQGSYNAGGVAASAGTHDGGGAVDVWGKGTSDATTVTNAMRKVGFAAWFRTPSQGNWGYHVHAIAIGDPELSRGARNQVADYLAGRNGLANDGRDTFTRSYVGITWEEYQKKAAMPVLHSWSMNYATKGKGMSGVTLAEASKFMGFALSQKVITTSDTGGWSAAVKRGDWYNASRYFIKALKAIQAKGRLTIDGVFGRQTGGYVDNFGYNIIYNG